MSKKKALNTVLRVSYKEYVESWASLIHTYYQQGMSDDALFQDLQMTAEGQVQFSLELSTVLTLIATMSFASKPKLCTNEKNRDLLKEQIVEAVYKKVLPDADAQTINSCIDYHNGRLTIFSQICKNIYSTQPKRRQTDLIGFARYLAAQVSTKPEVDNAIALERLGILLSSASDSYMMLLQNTTQDTIQMDGKPSFSVQK